MQQQPVIDTAPVMPTESKTMVHQKVVSDSGKNPMETEIMMNFFSFKDYER